MGRWVGHIAQKSTQTEESKNSITIKENNRVLARESGGLNVMFKAIYSWHSETVRQFGRITFVLRTDNLLLICTREHVTTPKHGKRQTGCGTTKMES